MHFGVQPAAAGVHASIASVRLMLYNIMVLKTLLYTEFLFASLNYSPPTFSTLLVVFFDTLAHKILEQHSSTRLLRVRMLYII